jgi:hypothetical protein
MTATDLSSRRLDVVTTCRRADLSILRKTFIGLRRFVPLQKLYVITGRRNIPKLQRALTADVHFLDEDELIPGMTLASLYDLSLPGLPKGAGWYFQQLLKFAFSFRRQEDDYYLIWDADTIPLRPLRFFDSSGRMLFTTATEQNPAYFDNYRHLLREEPHREFSFISQHMIVQKSILRELLSIIESNFPGDDSWAWKIMRNLKGTSTNLFSEYETFGHFVKNHYPSRAAYRELSWLREGAYQSFRAPSQRDLERLGREYDFVAFESSHMAPRRFVRLVRAWLNDRRGRDK